MESRQMATQNLSLELEIGHFNGFRLTTATYKENDYQNVFDSHFFDV